MGSYGGSSAHELMNVRRPELLTLPVPVVCGRGDVPTPVHAVIHTPAVLTLVMPGARLSCPAPAWSDSGDVEREILPYLA